MSRSDFAFIVMLFALIFLFQGEPDVWDKIHDAAMRSFECVPAQPQPRNAGEKHAG